MKSYPARFFRHPVVPQYLDRKKYLGSEMIELCGIKGFRLGIFNRLGLKFPFPVPVARVWGKDATVYQKGRVAQLKDGVEEDTTPYRVGDGGKNVRKQKEIQEGKRVGGWDKGVGKNAWWITGVRVRNDLPLKKYQFELRAVTMTCYAELTTPQARNPAQIPRVWRRTIYTNAVRYYLLAPETFALIEFVRQELGTDKCKPVQLHSAPPSVLLEAKYAVEGGWRPGWWADWPVAEVYDAYGESLRNENS